MSRLGKFGFPGLLGPFGPVDPRAGRWPSLADGMESLWRSLIPDLSQMVPEPKAGKGGGVVGPESQPPQVVRMRLVGGNAMGRVVGFDELPGRSNYFIGNDPKKWRTNVPSYTQVKYEGVYPGVDLMYHGNQRQLEYDFVVAPGADPNQIKLSFAGTDGMRVDAASGDLVLKVGDDEVRFRKPAVYQPAVAAVSDRRLQSSTNLSHVRAASDPSRRSESAATAELDGAFVIASNNQVAFRVAGYDPRRALMIDPVLIYSTYLGGSDEDIAWDVAVDTSGNPYVAGYTFSTNFPTASPFQATKSGDFDAFVTKLNATGSGLVYSTYLGGSGFDGGYSMSIAVDASGNAYIAGTTKSPDFPTTLGAFQPALGGNFQRAFVTELNATGSALVYSTYLGGSGGDYGEGIAVDAAGNAYVTGHTYSWNFPTVSPFQAALAGNFDVFVTKLNASGSALVYSTYLGGSDGEAARGIAVDASGNAYVAGYTSSGNFPTASPLQPANAGGYDAFVAKLNATGSGLVYSTYLGGAGHDEANGIAVDNSGNAYVTGGTNSTTFPTANALQPTYGGGDWDAFVAKLDPTGSVLVYSTYLGGSSDDDNPIYVYPTARTGIYPIGRIAVDASGNAYVTGGTASTNFPTASPLQGTNAGGYDAFVAELNATGSALEFSTYLGGTGDDLGLAIAVDTSGSAFVVGTTNSTDFPTLNAPQSAYGGGAYDAFVAKISLADVPGVSLTPASLSFASQTVGMTTSPQTVTLRNVGSAPLSIGSIVASGDFAQTNTCGGGIPGGSSCIINVTFTPTATGTRTGLITITDNAAGSPQTVGLTGTGVTSTVGTPAVNLSPSVMDFPDQTLSTTSAAHTVTVTNTGTANLMISSAAIAGTNASDFSTSDDMCTGATVAPNKTCSVSVTFIPMATGYRVGTLQFSDNAGGSPQSVYLFGNGTAMPVILIPGIMGSTLMNNGGTGPELWVADFQDWTYKNLSLFPTDLPSATISATDVIRNVLFEDYYGNFINFLTSQQDISGNNIYPLYQLNGNPSNLSAGCPTTQAMNSPKLFLFPYDWRQSNAVSAAELRDYVRCIQNFYPGTKVNIVAHSMGGLVARWYVLHNPANSVNELVSIATPWLGAPQVINVLATGQYWPITPVLMIDPVLKYIAGSMTGVHELLPSPKYIDLGGAPFVEQGWDWNGDGNSSQIYTYTQYRDAMNQHFGFDHDGIHEFYPGNATETFHNTSTPLGAMDGWPNDSTGVNYYQLYGVESKEKTIGEVFAVNFAGCLSLSGIRTCPIIPSLQPVYTCGDGTVPVLSATVSSSGCTFPFPEDTHRIPIFSGAVDHIGLLSNSDVQNQVLGLLNQPLSTQTTPAQISTKGKKEDSGPPSFQPANYLTIVGGNNVVVSDTLGNSTAVITGILQGSVPDVSTYPLGGGMALILPIDNEYTVTFQTTTIPLNIILNIGTPDSTSEAIRYVDINQPAGLNCKLHFLPGSVGPLQVDTNKDGSFATTINPSNDATGDAAKDTTPPVVSFNATVVGAITTVTVAATDAGSGVKDLLYSIDGMTFQSYAGPFQLDASRTPVVYAFSDDNALNRSSVVTFNLPRPIVSFQPGSLSFPGTPLGVASSPQTLTVGNGGTAPLVISGVSVTGDFSQSNNCPSSPAAIPTNGNCTITMTFTPTMVGARTGLLTIIDNAPGSPQTVTLTGTGTAPVVSFSAPSLSFGNQPLGTTSGSQAVTLSNTGSAALTIRGIATSANFGETNNCGGSVAASGSCTINVTFTPTATGPLTGTLTITDNNNGVNGSQQAVSLNGVGIGRPGVAILSTSQSKSGTTLTLTITVKNNGTGNGQNLLVNQVVLRTLGGSGTATLTSPILPLSVGNLALGATAPITLKLNVPSTVTKLSVTLNGTIQDVVGNTFSYSIGSMVLP
jgi:pimeloyl-ACP methyl ester carboxylesterase